MMKYVSRVDFKVNIEQRRDGDPDILIADNCKILESYQKSPFAILRKLFYMI